MNRTPAFVLYALMLLAVSPLAAQTGVKDSAINHVPEDVVFFHSVMNLQATFQRALASEMVTELRQIPAAAEVIAGLEQPPETTAETDAETAALLAYRATVLNLLGSEVFVYGEQSLLEFNRQAQHITQISAEAANGNEPFRGEELFMSLPDEAITDFVIPSLVIGMRMQDVTAGHNYVGFCQLLATSNGPAWMQPHIRQELIDGQPVVWVTVTGSMIPWEQEVGADEVARQAAERFKRLIADRSITLAVGVRDGHLLVTFGEDLGPFRRFSREKTLYASQAAERLRKAELSHPLAIEYCSSEWAAGLTKTDYSLVQWLAELVEANQEIITATDPSVQLWFRENLNKAGQALAEMDRQWKANRLPTVGKLGWCFADDQGIAGETVHYGAIDRRRRDGIPAVLDHVGPTPLVVAASSGQVDKRQWSVITSLLRACVHAANAYYQAVLEMVESDSAEVDTETIQQTREIAANAESIANDLGRVLDTFDNQWLDSLGDEGWAMVLTRGPDEKRPMDFALVNSVSDAAGVQAAAESLRTQMNVALQSYAKFAPDSEEVKGAEIPAAIVKVDELGTHATLPTPDVPPQALLTNDWLAIGSGSLAKLADVTPHDQLPMLANDATVVGYLHINFREYIDVLAGATKEQNEVGLLGPFPIPIEAAAVEDGDSGTAVEPAQMSPEDTQRLWTIARSIRHFTRVTTVHESDTIVRWRLAVNLRR